MRSVRRAHSGRFSDILIDDPEEFLAASDDFWDLPPDEPFSERRSFDPKFLLVILVAAAAVGGYFAWQTLGFDTTTGVVDSLGSTAAVETGDVTETASGGSGADEPTGIQTDADESPALPSAGDDDPAAVTSTTAPETTTTTAPTTSTFPPDGSIIYYNDFSSGPLGPEWEQYNSVGNGGWGLRRPSALSIIPDAGSVAGGSCLAITASMGTGPDAGQLVSGGVKLLGYSQTYGRYTVRARIDDDPSRVTSGVALLWPTSGLWPQHGEINIIENFYNRATRSPVESRLHWMKPDAVPPYDRADDDLVQADLPVDGTDWHTYTLVWTADLVSIAVDGGPAQVLSTGNAVIPTLDMDLTLQLDGFDFPGSGQQPVIDGEVSMCVDFVQVERN